MIQITFWRFVVQGRCKTHAISSTPSKVEVNGQKYFLYACSNQGCSYKVYSYENTSPQAQIKGALITAKRALSSVTSLPAVKDPSIHSRTGQ